MSERLPSPISVCLPELLRGIFLQLITQETQWANGWSSCHGLANENLLVLPLVCKRWHAIATPLVWHSVKVASQETLDAVIGILTEKPFTTSFPHGDFVKEVHVEAHGRISEGGPKIAITPEAVRALVTGCPYLEELTLICHRDDHRSSPIGLAELTPERCTRLKRLKVFNYINFRDCNDQTADDISEEWAVLARNPPPLLAQVYFNNCRGVPPPFFTHLIHNIGRRILSLYMQYCDDIPRSFWENDLPRFCPRLESISVHASTSKSRRDRRSAHAPPAFTPDDATIDRLSDAFPLLTCLAFSPRCVSERGLRKVATFRRLGYLILRGSIREYPTEVWAEVAAALAGTLAYLNAAYLDVKVVRLFWEKCPRLAYVGVSHLRPRDDAQADPWFEQDDVKSCATFMESRHRTAVTLRRNV